MVFVAEDTLELVIAFLFAATLAYFLALRRTNVNFYSQWSIILVCIGLSLRLMLYTIDVTLKLLGKPGGLIGSDGKWQNIFRNIFVYQANCLFYFSYFAVGCDWYELILAFRSLALRNQPVDQLDRLRAKVRKFFTVVGVLMATITIIFLIANLIANLTNLL